MTNYNHKLYLVTHKGISSGYQTAQVAHAITEFLIHFPDIAAEWYSVSNTVVALEVIDTHALEVLFDSATDNGMGVIPFHEPDLDNQLTAIAFVPNERNSDFLFDLPTVGTDLSESEQAVLREQESANRDSRREVAAY